MYTYQNGLQCNASKLRIQAFEAIVPPVFAGLLIVGIVVIFDTAFGYTSPLNAIALAGVASCAYCLTIGLSAYAVFRFWCKPLQLKKPEKISNDHH